MSTIGQQEIHDVMASIWTSLLGMQIEPVQTVTLNSHHFTGRIQIHGAWNGRVVVRCAPVLARRVASVMFELDASAVSSADVRDAIGEITNIAAGNLKALMPTACTLGLPLVSEAVSSDAEPAEPNDSPSQQAYFESAGEPLTLSLIADD